ncbi:CheR family methyltransferase [Vulgatibacter sp.]|uniref:CheR family methyltransferase n=1 Tax=Vulgatibacter sp. TaxID=1971226 RepID=UPI003567457F
MERPFDQVARVLRVRAGLAIEPTRYERVESAARKAMVQAGIADPSIYAAQLAAGRLPLDPLLDEVTVGETYFFRDLPHFEMVRRLVIPTFRDGELQAWSAGCSSGEEAYSLAILFEREGIGHRSAVLGTDIAPGALARAREALYRRWSLRGPGAAWVRPWLHEEGERLRLAATIRARVRFRMLNLASDPYPRGQHLIFCRNVLIYFGPEGVAQVARRLYEALAPGGWLVTGPSDPPLGARAPFAVELRPEGIFYRRPAIGKERKPPAAKRVLPQLPATARAVASPPPRPLQRQAPAPRPPPQRRQAPVPPPLEKPAPGEAARQALVGGRYDEAALLAADAGDPASLALHIRALANGGNLPGALRVAEEATARHPFATELVHLRAVLLADLGRDAQALEAVRSLLYLDPSLVMGHFLRGTLLRRRGDTAGARRAFERARDLCAATPPDAQVPLSDGEKAGRLRVVAEQQLAALE